MGKNLATCEGQSMFESDPVMSICADASLSGWGAECNGLRTGMTWSQEEARRHINELELLGAFNALRSFAAFRKNCTVELRLDNTTAVAYINKKGGTHSESLTRLAVQVARWCEERNIILRAQYLPGILNVIADRESRRKIDWSDWKLDPMTFQTLRGVWKVSIDLFANPWNAQLPKFVSWNPQPGAWAWDAFSLNWAELTGSYAFPPFSVIRDCLSKARREEASILLICPLWPAQPWFPTLLSMACDIPRVLKPMPGLLKSVKGETNPLCSVPGFRLVAWKLSGRSTESRVFRERWSSYSSRGAAASKAVAADISVDTVWCAGHWASASTFRKFYHREVPADSSLVEVVLQPDGISRRNGYLICSCPYQFTCVYLYACTRENCVWLIDTDVRSGVVVSLCGYMYLFLSLVALKITVQID